MKKFFLFLMITASVLSCKKEATEQKIITTSEESGITNSSAKNGDETGALKVTLVLNSKWVSFYSDCLPSWWYCWEISTGSDARSYIKINDKEKLITFGIDNTISPDYHRKFVKSSNFDFPEDSYLKKEIVNASIGLNKEIYVKKGLYHFENIDGILTITAPYSIVD